MSTMPAYAAWRVAKPVLRKKPIFPHSTTQRDIISSDLLERCETGEHPEWQPSVSDSAERLSYSPNIARKITVRASGRIGGVMRGPFAHEGTRGRPRLNQ